MLPEDRLNDLLQIEALNIPSCEEEGSSTPDANLLIGLRIASPCNASWEEMESDDLVRLCQHCRKNVYNLSEMSRSEAAAFVREAEGKLCVRFYRRRDGTLLTHDCPVGWRAARRRLLKWLGSAVAMAFGLAGVKPPTIERYSTMGLFDNSSPIGPEYPTLPQSGLFAGAVLATILLFNRGQKSDQ
jgi:hypothetical protein